MTVNTLDTREQHRSSRTVAELLWLYLPMAASAFLFSALIYYQLNRHEPDALDPRSSLQGLVAGIYRILGFAPSIMLFGLLLSWSVIWFVTGRIERPASRLLRLLAMAVMLGVFFNIGDGNVARAPHKGELGAWLAERLVNVFGPVPSVVLVWGVTVASLLLATDFFFFEWFERMRHRRSAVEAGVETAVTDHLRGLAAATATDAHTPAAAQPLFVDATVDDAPAEAETAALAAEAPEEGQAPAAEPTAIEPEEPPRRRSYFERRREREPWVSERARRPAEED